MNAQFAIIDLKKAMPVWSEVDLRFPITLSFHRQTQIFKLYDMMKQTNVLAHDDFENNALFYLK